MPEYLAPGVYVEEVSFRSKSIEGVPTSTTGMAGSTRSGPVQYPGGPKTTEPRLITSFTEFERVYGGLDVLRVGVDREERIGYLAHAVRAFFMNGGKRVYVSRVFAPFRDGDGDITDNCVASGSVPVTTLDPVTWTARWPGDYGNVAVTVTARRSRDLSFEDPEFGDAIQARRAKYGAVVEILTEAEETAMEAADTDPSAIRLAPVDNLAVVTTDADGKQIFIGSAGEVMPTADDEIRLVEIDVTVRVDSERVDFYESLGTHPRQKRDIARILQMDDPEDENAAIAFQWEGPEESDGDYDFSAARLMKALVEASSTRLEDGSDGDLITPADLLGEEANLDDPSEKATGLEALGEIDDIAIVACPDASTLADDASRRTAVGHLITHAERLRYRIAVVDGPEASSMNEIRKFKGKFDSKYAALYHPWIEILDPTERPAQGAPPKRLLLPPSGFVTGIYARSDIERGVHKAPANEVVRGLTRFEININKARQDVLNPEGINAFRFFEGRGYRLWGARTMSSDPEWKYVNVRRLFVFVEHSIDKGTQWAVFEPNNRHLWANVRSTIEDFLLVLWRQGALLGEKPEEAFFVRCDRTTMTQNDLDNGRMVCLIGVAPVKPAEYVIFRIGQWTADSKVQ